MVVAGSAAAQLRAPDAVNILPIKPNPTAELAAVYERLGNKDYSQLIHASCYSEANQAVVVLVSGNTQEYSGQFIVDFVVKEFGKAHVPATGFLDMPDWEGVTVSFFLNGDAYGPYSGEDWREGFDLVKYHAPQAWYLD